MTKYGLQGLLSHGELALAVKVLCRDVGIPCTSECQIISGAEKPKSQKPGLVTQAEGDEVRVFSTMARGVEVYQRYLIVAVVLVCAAIFGGLIQRWIRRS